MKVVAHLLPFHVFMEFAKKTLFTETVLRKDYDAA